MAMRAFADRVDGGRFGKHRTSAQEFFSTIQPTGLNKTQKSYKAAYTEFLQWLGKDAAAPLKDITAERCMQYLGHLFGSGLKSGSVALHRRILCTAFNRAVRELVKQHFSAIFQEQWNSPDKAYVLLAIC